MKSKFVWWPCLCCAVISCTAVGSMELDSVSNETVVVSYLAQFPYPGTNISSYAESDFSRQSQAVLGVLQSAAVVDSTNAFLRIADYLAQGVPLSVEGRDDDFRAALRHDRFIQFGDSNYVMRAGGTYYGPTALDCRDRYLYRDRYNSELSSFRVSMLRCAKRELFRPRWQIYTEEQRSALLDEFYRRADATEEELRRIQR